MHCSIQCKLLLAWEDYYSTNSTKLIYHRSITSTQTFFASKLRLHVWDVFFHDLKNIESAGAIHFVADSNSSQLLVEGCSFYSCSSQNEPGGIFLINSSFILGRVCDLYTV